MSIAVRQFIVTSVESIWFHGTLVFYDLHKENENRLTKNLFLMMSNDEFERESVRVHITLVCVW